MDDKPGKNRVEQHGNGRWKMEGDSAVLQNCAIE